ncbi:lytic polysaccharide monooxygenase [Stenotrophomonas sp. NPDC078853]|uniref:lytic polysaccharide monooxygenase n=1 Tax=Stenotrophomonas sp. NPDC078853 TaxID=3364534 RepID=UPI00384BB6CB
MKRSAGTSAFSMLLTVAAAMGGGLAPWDAHAHGAPASPIARQYLCFKERGYDWPADGSKIPSADCRQAYREVMDAWPFQQWNEVSANPQDKGDTLEKVKAAVPDGLLCAGGDVRKRGLDQASQAWRAQPVTTDAQGQLEVVWDLTQAHNPSWMRVFLSKPSYDGSRALRWDDLEEIYNEAAPPPVPGTPLPTYTFNVPIPADRAGRAVLYHYWQRDDSGNEGFFSCTDIDIQR